ncbi:hypothetical protein ENUP19_0018G0076 [Entamoeba nuttalli]|uniref:Uncharacterized protein n=2 Tax=Entamoeba nuttalli TaxID=412467 RepID=K2GU48_ENTNP|nr:hypothetical protein ENU1_199960 [Entamoeba nuttalli P19]EKE37367.1 hypothetical protein ENU1_199960 [Entamoeba nuttalli P19]|eukprot:XP_008860297.1 hypothetical protein ENU1_199960 [Entamoeba nuttalli P19]
MSSTTFPNNYNHLLTQISNLPQKSIDEISSAFLGLVNCISQNNQNSTILLKKLYNIFLDNNQSEAEKKENLSKLLKNIKENEVSFTQPDKHYQKKVGKEIGKTNTKSFTQGVGNTQKGCVSAKTAQINKGYTLSDFFTAITHLYSSEINKELLCNICQKLLSEVFIQLLLPDTHDEMKSKFIDFINEINKIQSGHLSPDFVFTNKYRSNETIELIQEETNLIYYSFMKEFKKVLVEMNSQYNGFTKNVQKFCTDIQHLLQEECPQSQLYYLEDYVKKFKEIMHQVLNKVINKDNELKVKQNLLKLITPDNCQLLLKTNDLNKFVDDILNAPDLTKVSELSSKIHDLEREKDDAESNKKKLMEEISKTKHELNTATTNIKRCSKELMKVKNEKEEFFKELIEEDSVKAQSIAIPFELWYIEATYTCIIFIKEKMKRIKFVLQLRHSNKNGELIHIRDNIYIRIYFTHKHFRREGDDIVYYINDNEIPKDHRASVIHPGGSTYTYSYGNFKDNQIIVEQCGFTNNSHSSKGRFIIRKVDNINLLPPSENELIKKRQDDASKMCNFVERENSTKHEEKIYKQKEDSCNRKVDDLQKEEKVCDDKLESIPSQIERLELELSEEQKRINESSSKSFDLIQKKIIAKAIEENRIIRFSCSHHSETEIVETSDGLWIKLAANDRYLCFLDSTKIPLRKSGEKGWFTSKPTTFYYHLLRELTFTNKDEVVPNNDIIFDTLLKDQQVIIFNVDIPNSYNEKYLPIVTCKRKAFRMDNPEDFMIFPVKTPKCPTRFVFKNGYYVNTDDGGIIIINVSFKENEPFLIHCNDISSQISPRKCNQEIDKKKPESVPNEDIQKPQQSDSLITDTQKPQQCDSLVEDIQKPQQSDSFVADTKISLTSSDVWIQKEYDNFDNIRIFEKDYKTYGIKFDETSSKPGDVVDMHKPGDVFKYNISSYNLDVYCLKCIGGKNKKSIKSKTCYKELECYIPKNLKSTLKDYFGIMVNLGSSNSTNTSNTSILLPIDANKLQNDKYLAIFEYKPDKYIGVRFHLK